MLNMRAGCIAVQTSPPLQAMSTVSCLQGLSPSFSMHLRLGILNPLSYVILTCALCYQRVQRPAATLNSAESCGVLTLLRNIGLAVSYFC